jgi:hypothetical protein
VSVATRYVAKRKLKCDQLVLIAGGIPNELKTQDFEFLDKITKVSLIYGNQDEYLTSVRLKGVKKHYFDLFGSDATILTFEGKHEMPKKLINEIVS